MPSKRAKRVRLPDDCVHTIAQTLGLSVTPDAAKMLAPAAEYQLRKLIHSSKSYMRHAKRTRLTTTDVRLAHRAHFGKSLFGHPSSAAAAAAAAAPAFVPVANGIFVDADAMHTQSLRQLYTEPLPRKRHAALKASFVTTAAPLHRAPLPTEAQRVPNVVQSMRRILASRDQRAVDAALRRMPRYREAHVRALVSLLQHAVHRNATPSGDTRLLSNALRVLDALIARNRAPLDMFTDSALPIVLTCLLGTHVGDGDRWQMREHAALTLGRWARATSDSHAVLRVVKTAVSCLTDAHAPLDTILGAALALGAVGADALRTHFVPHLRALLQSLRQRAQQAQDEAVRNEIEARVVRLSAGISKALSRLDSRRVSEASSVV